MNQTKYILHGGFPPDQKQVNDNFFKEILVDTGRQVNILIVYFATDNGDKYYPQDIKQFEKNNDGKKLHFDKADDKLFIKQLKNADVIYFHGGSSLQLLAKLKEFPRFSEKMTGKVVAGDSAGANMLSTVFYSKKNGVCQGLGILPIKLIPHYIEEFKDKLSSVNPTLQTIRLPEYSFTVLKI